MIPACEQRRHVSFVTAPGIRVPQTRMGPTLRGDPITSMLTIDVLVCRWLVCS